MLFCNVVSTCKHDTSVAKLQTESDPGVYPVCVFHAKRYWLMPRGPRNSSRSLSPGWMGGSFFAAPPALFSLHQDDRLGRLIHDGGERLLKLGLTLTERPDAPFVAVDGIGRRAWKGGP